MSVTYEWVLETLAAPNTGDNDPDIIEVHHFDSYADALAWGQTEDGPWRIGLVRDVGNDLEGLTDRSWAYLKDGALPKTFNYGADEDSGVAVPKRFHDELARQAVS